MLDINKFEFEESSTYEGIADYYFIYDSQDLSICGFEEPASGKETVECMTVTLSVSDNGDIGMVMSPTVLTEDNILQDTEWKDLYEGIHYTQEMIQQLLAKANY